MGSSDEDDDDNGNMAGMYNGSPRSDSDSDAGLDDEPPPPPEGDEDEEDEDEEDDEPAPTPAPAPAPADDDDDDDDDDDEEEDAKEWTEPLLWSIQASFYQLNSRHNCNDSDACYVRALDVPPIVLETPAELKDIATKGVPRAKRRAAIASGIGDQAALEDVKNAEPDEDSEAEFEF